LQEFEAESVALFNKEVFDETAIAQDLEEDAL
jgi:hypothetical protein